MGVVVTLGVTVDIKGVSKGFILAPLKEGLLERVLKDSCTSSDFPNVCKRLIPELRPPCSTAIVKREESSLSRRLAMFVVKAST